MMLAPQAQGSASPSRPRPKQHRSATNAPHARVNQSPRRPKSNRAANPRHAPDLAVTDGEVFSGEELSTAAVTSLRNLKKQSTQSQPASDRLLPSADVTGAALTDSEISPSKPIGTPARSTAYAGPTFHASPAASALPIPKFLPRSLPAKPRAGPPTPEAVSDSASSASPSPPSPSRMPVPAPGRCDESPLNMLFSAHRQELARNGSGNPGQAPYPTPMSPSPARNEMNRPRPESHGSGNGMFPIELDGDSRIHPNGYGHGHVQNIDNRYQQPFRIDNRYQQPPKIDSKFQHPSPPVAPPYGVRSVTAPSKIPQAEPAPAPNNDAALFQDLMNRLSQSSQKRPVSATPPHYVNHAPSEPSSRHQSPSPFHDGTSQPRRASGPVTPGQPGVKAIQDPSSDLHYGNRNLSPMFKAAQGDASVKRNSGLRTEITADAFPPVYGSPSQDAAGMPRMPLGNAFDVNARRGSVPQQIPPFNESPNYRKTRTPGRRPHSSRPDSYPHINKYPSADTQGEVKAKPAMANPFIPASVQAKKYSVAPVAPKAPDNSALEQDLKRMLNLNPMSDTAVSGVR